MMYISYSKSNGYLYAQLAESARNGNSVSKTYVANLGRVLDKEKGIYRNRERGVFTYDISTDTYGCYSLNYLNLNPLFFSKLNKVWNILI